MMEVAKTQYNASKNPNDCMLTYLAARRKQVLLGLFKTQSKLLKVYEYMSNDFRILKWKKSASTAAFDALKKKKYRM